MIKKLTYYDIICDRCGKSLTQESGYYYPDANTAAFDASVSEWQMIKYGHLGSDWKDVLRKGFSECFRVLRPGGFLIFKWNETDISISEILKLTERSPVFGHRSGKTAKTHWVCFMKEQGVTINP